MKKLAIILGFAIAIVSCSGDDGSSGGCGVAKATEKTSTPFTNGCGIAVSNKGRIAVSVYNGPYGLDGEVRIYKNYADLKAGILQNTVQVIAPEAVAFDSDENLYVAETEGAASVRIFGSNDYYFLPHKTIQIGFVNPRGLAIDSEDRLYIADDGNGRIVRFNDAWSSDEYITFDNLGTGLKGLAISGDKLYATNYTQNKVWAFEIGPDASVINATLGQVSVAGATDISVKGNKVVVTSYATGKMTILSGCDFSDEKKTEYDAFGPCYGTAFINGSKLIGAFYSQTAIKEISVK